MSILSVDQIQPIGSGTTVTVNKSVTLESGNTNITGVCTATSFSGSGANLTSLPSQVTIANNADNRVITGGSGTNLNGEANLTFDGSDLTVSGKTAVSVNKNTTALVIDGTSSGTAYGETGGRIEFLMLNEVNQFTGNYAARISPYLDRGNNGFGLKFDVRYSAGTTYEALNITADYEVLPGSNGAISLGNSSYKWSNIFTNDLNLSNEGKTNDVDGTWGDYTIQEGESDLFLINNRNGKKYKFNLTEVS